MAHDRTRDFAAECGTMPKAESEYLRCFVSIENAIARLDAVLDDMKQDAGADGPMDLGDIARYEKPAKYARGLCRALDGELG